MAYDNDPPEYTGTTRTIPADPKTKAVATKPGSHAKTAIVGPRKAFEAAALETQEARVELIEAINAFRESERAENAALAAWCGHPLNRPSPDEVTRAYLKREGEQRERNVKAGLPAGHQEHVAATDQSPITLAALNRGRHAGGTAAKPGVPLRGNSVRRTV